MPASPPAGGTKVNQIAASAMHAEWTVVYTDNPDRHERVICFAVLQDSTVAPLIYDENTGFIINAGELGGYTLQ